MQPSRAMRTRKTSQRGLRTPHSGTRLVSALFAAVVKRVYLLAIKVTKVAGKQGLVTIHTQRQHSRGCPVVFRWYGRVFMNSGVSCIDVESPEALC